MLFNRKNGWIGVDVGASNLKLAQVERQGGMLKVRAAAIVPRRGPWTQADDSLESLSTRQEIERALATIDNLHGRRTAAVLSMAVSDVAPGRELAVTAGGVESARSFASWTPNGVKSDDGYTFAVSTPAAEQIADDLLDVGLSCRTIDSMTHALARAVAWASPNTRDPIGVLDWGYSGAMYCSVRDGQPTYVRQLRDTGLAQLEDDVVAELDVSRAEATQLIARATTSDNGLKELVSELAAPLAEHVAAELSKTLGHLRSHRKSDAPEKVYLVGGGAVLGAESSIESKAKCQVTPWKLPGAMQNESQPLCLFAPAIALSALAWEGR